MPLELKDQSPPRGFEFTTSGDGDFMIRYRTTGMGCAIVFFFVWLSGWTAGCVTFTAMALFNPEGVSYVLLAFMVPFWIVEFVTIGFLIWYFVSRTSFIFQPDQLVIERSAIWYRRRRIFPKKEITAVRQIKDGGQGNDSFPTWGLVVMAGPGVQVLNRQPIDKSDWLGSIIARWAEVPYEPAQERKYEVL